MKKIIGFLVLLVGFSLFVPVMSFAESSTTGTSTIEQLKQRILELQAQILELRKQQEQATIELLKTLASGSSGQDVLTLQAFLATDPSIYPEGKITGFFGPLTAKAVKKFQEKNGIEAVGFVGPKTLKKLNEQLKKSSVVVVGDTQTVTASSTCTILPPGHYIAPGLNKKNSDEDDEDDDNKKKNKGKKDDKWGNVPFTIPCGQLPPGIAKKLNPGTTTPPINDGIAPVIVSTSVTDIGAISARINWTTNEATRAQIAYGTTTAYTIETSWSSGKNTNHSHLITGLTANTTYHFRVQVKDLAGNITAGPDQTFTTLAEAPADTTAPVILSVSVADISTTSARVNWSVNETTYAQVAYGTTTSYTTETGWSSGTNTNHSHLITGLTANTTYHFRVQVKDLAGNVTSSADMTFTTATVPPPSDTAAPVISGVSAGSITSTTATISWTTNENADSRAYYGTTTPLALGSALWVYNATLGTSHSMDLSGLTASTTHYYVVESKDGVGNTATSTENSFTTLP